MSVCALVSAKPRDAAAGAALMAAYDLAAALRVAGACVAWCGALLEVISNVLLASVHTVIYTYNLECTLTPPRLVEMQASNG